MRRQRLDRPIQSHAAAFAIALGAVALLQAARVNAQVLEVGEGGAVTVYDRPMIFDAEGSRPVIAGRATPKLSAPASQGALSNAAMAAELSPDLVEAVAWRESRLRPGVVSPAGAVGEMQLMPGTARAMGVDPYDSDQNYAGGARYLGDLLRRYDGDLVRALAAYNAGPGAVDRFGGVPPFKETRDYVAAVLARLSERAVSGGGEADKR